VTVGVPHLVGREEELANLFGLYHEDALSERSLTHALA
jgi:hypothetical protein